MKDNDPPWITEKPDKTHISTKQCIISCSQQHFFWITEVEKKGMEKEKKRGMIELAPCPCLIYGVLNVTLFITYWHTWIPLCSHCDACEQHENWYGSEGEPWCWCRTVDRRGACGAWKKHATRQLTPDGPISIHRDSIKCASSSYGHLKDLLWFW